MTTTAAQNRRRTKDAAARWRFKRALARVAAADDVLADYATSWCGRPFRRRDIAPLESAVDLPGAKWTIEGDLMAEFLYEDGRPGRLLVYEIALVQPLRKRLRTRHLRIEYVDWDASS